MIIILVCWLQSYIYFNICIDGNLFSATVADFSSMDPIIYKEQLQTEQYDSLSLNGNIIFYIVFYSIPFSLKYR